MDKPTERDMELIRKQLGREPRKVMGVAKQCPCGAPVVIITYPLANSEVFPTIFWLTCSRLVKVISCLEGKGWGKRLGARLIADSGRYEALVKADKRVAEMRISLLNPEDMELFVQNRLSQRQRDSLRETGITGSRKRGVVKCLHAHYADYLVNEENPVGRWVDELLSQEGFTFCQEPGCECSEG